ncbi:MAG TPA: LptE family protein [Nitrospiraceae bacterium]|nr:LptE family protein [Nitrospiraceae bacterium]
MWFDPVSGVPTGQSHPLILTLIVLIALGAGCGYQFRVEGAGPTIGGAPAEANQATAPRMVIQFFENKSFEPNLEHKYTNYARHEFAAGSGARVVPRLEDADLVLKGSILSVSIPTIAFSQTITLESRVTVTVTAKVEEARTGKVIWTQTSTASSEFFVTNDLQFNRVLQTRALEQAGRLIAEDLATRFLNHLELTQNRPSAGSPTPTSAGGPTDGPARSSESTRNGPAAK